MATILFLKSQFPYSPKNPTLSCLPPVILVSQLYSILSNRTDVDRELDRLKRANRVRMLKVLVEAGEEYAVVLTSDYEQKIRDLMASCDADQRLLLERLIDRLLPAHHDVSISSQVIADLVLQGSCVEQRMTADSATRFLMQKGLVLARAADSFWLSVPSMAALTIDLARGRKELIAAVQRTKYQEILQKATLCLNHLLSCLFSPSSIPTHLSAAGT